MRGLRKFFGIYVREVGGERLPSLRPWRAGGPALLASLLMALGTVLWLRKKQPEKASLRAALFPVEILFNRSALADRVLRLDSSSPETPFSEEVKDFSRVCAPSKSGPFPQLINARTNIAANPWREQFN